MKKITGVLAAIMMIMVFQITTFAKIIYSIPLNVVYDIRIGQLIGEEDFEINKGNENKFYTIGDGVACNKGESWTADMTPEYVLLLNAQDGYNFDDKKSQVNVTGTGAQLKSQKLLDAYTMEVEITLPKLGDVQIANMTGPAALDKNGRLSWKTASNAGRYEIHVFRGETEVGKLYSTEAEADISAKFSRSGYYYAKVRAISSAGEHIRTDWVESNSINLSDADVVVLAAARQKAANTGAAWMMDNKGWWYRDSNGNRVIGKWMQIDNKWYCFDETGIMKTGWVESDGKWYYLTSSGDMLTNGDTPDGHKVGADGVRVS